MPGSRNLITLLRCERTPVLDHALPDHCDGHPREKSVHLLQRDLPFGTQPWSRFEHPAVQLHWRVQYKEVLLPLLHLWLSRHRVSNTCALLERRMACLLHAVADLFLRCNHLGSTGGNDAQFSAIERQSKC